MSHGRSGFEVLNALSYLYGTERDLYLNASMIIVYLGSFRLVLFAVYIILVFFSSVV